MIHPLADCKSNIPESTRVWQFCVIMSECHIGESCNICANVLIENDVYVGNHVTIKSGVQLWDGVTLEDNVFIGPNVTFTNDLYPRSGNHEFELKRTLVKEGASIGANSTIVCGITIGRNTLIGAGSVITKDVEDNTVWYGNPAKQHGFITEDGIILNMDKIDKNGKKHTL